MINTKYHTYYSLGSKAQIQLALNRVNKRSTDENIISALCSSNLHKGFLPNIRKLLENPHQTFGDIMYVVPLEYITTNEHLFTRPRITRITYADMPDNDQMLNLNPMDVIAFYTICIACSEVVQAHKIEEYLCNMFKIPKSTTHFDFMKFLGLNDAFDLTKIRQDSPSDTTEDDSDGEIDSDELLALLLDKETKSRHILSYLTAKVLLALHGKLVGKNDFREILREKSGVPYSWKELPYICSEYKQGAKVVIHVKSRTIEFKEITVSGPEIKVLDDLTSSMLLDLASLKNKRLVVPNEDAAKQIIEEMMSRNLIYRVRTFGYWMNKSPLAMYIENLVNIWFLRHHLTLDRVVKDLTNRNQLEDAEYIQKRLDKINSIATEG